MFISLSAVWLPWVSRRSVTTTSLPASQKKSVSRLVESMPRIWMVSICMVEFSPRYTTVLGFITLPPV